MLRGKFAVFDVGIIVTRCDRGVCRAELGLQRRLLGSCLQPSFCSATAALVFVHPFLLYTISIIVASVCGVSYLEQIRQMRP